MDFSKQIQISTKFRIWICTILGASIFATQEGLVKGGVSAKTQLHCNFLWGLIPRKKVSFPNFPKGTKWACRDPNDQNFSDEITIHTGHYAMLNAKTKTNPQSRKQTKKHVCRMLNHYKVPGNFSPRLWFFLKEKNYPSVLSAILESLGREVKRGGMLLKAI